jgi:glutathionyl-hydroquinone reductase
MGWFKNYLRKKLKKIVVNYKLFESSIFKDKFEYTGYETICTAIVRKTINHKDTKYTIAPLSNKRYLVNKTIDIFVIMEDSKVEITNHVYHYVITLPKKDIVKLVNHFDKKVDEERIMYENQIKSQIDNTLHKIYDKINNLQ